MSATQAHVTVTEHDDGHFVLHVTGTPDAALLATVTKSLSNAKDNREIQLRSELWLRLQLENAKPAEVGVPFIVPQLCFAFDEEITLPLDAENCLGAEGWNPLIEYRPIGEDEFAADDMTEGSLRQYLLRSVQDLVQRPDMNLPLLLRARIALEEVLETRLLAARRKTYT